MIKCPAFIAPYLLRKLNARSLSELDGNPIALMISPLDDSGAINFENLTEQELALTPAEAEFADSAGKKTVILRCVGAVGTGMAGFTRALAESIWLGTFFHLPDNNAHISAIHATDIAEAASRVLEGPEPKARLTIYNIAPAVPAGIHDLAEALAYRMSNKRISTMSTGPQQAITRWIYGKRRLRSYTAERTLDGSKFRTDYGYEPEDVCTYLRTHTYDESSL